MTDKHILNVNISAMAAKVAYSHNFFDRYSIDTVTDLEMDSFVGIENAINNGHGEQVIQEYNSFCERLALGDLEIETIYNPVIWKIGVWLDALTMIDEEDIKAILGPLSSKEISVIKEELAKLAFIGNEITNSVDPEILSIMDM